MAEKDFKLLAIRALKECSPKYSKLLEPGKFYQFYSDYEFKDDEDGFLKEIKCRAKDSSIYSLKQKEGPSVNISAIVGKNGSGKSTLFDLLYQFCFYLSMSMGLLKSEIYGKKWNEIRKSYEEMKAKDGLSVEVIFKIDDKIISYVNKREKEQNGTNPEWPLIDVFYWSDGGLFKKNKKRDLEYLSESNKRLESKRLDGFFYSIAINYSLYGLNTNEMGMWPFALFHKNDGYQTPIVLNPYRENGNINVNSETELAKYRLLANKVYEYFLRKKSVNKTNQIGMIYDYFIDSIELSLNLPKIREIADWKHGSVIQENISHDGTYDVYERMIKFWTIKDVVSDYRDYKIERIRKNYSAIADVDEFLKGYRQNGKGMYSHIFYKLCQAMHFIDNSKLKTSKCGAFSVIRMKLPEFMNAFDIDEGSSLSEIMCKLPPSVFKWNFVLRHKNDDKESHSLSSFDQLSSGEKQSILVSNTIIYHLNNLQSVYFGIKQQFVEYRVAFEYVNIMLDEIELYFHPEFQRTFLKELLDQLDYVDYTGGIKGINIMFITHSPFILSDIPKQNCLFLEKAGVYTQPVRKNNLHTFGGNIYDMLRNSFFIKDSVGSYAKSKIDEIIDVTNEVFNIDFKEKEALKEKEKLINRINEKEACRDIISAIDDSLEPLEEKEIRLINRIEEKVAGYRKTISMIEVSLESLMVKKKQLINRIKEKEAEYRNIISLIDDSLIKNKISQMLDKCLCSSKEYQIRVLKNEIQRIQEEIDLIEKEK